jgi:hypothetical protein
MVSNCNGSSTYHTWEAVSLISMLFWNTEPLMQFEMCLWEQSYICMLFMQLHTELIALPCNAIHIKCFEGPMNTNVHFDLLGFTQF